MGLEHEYDRMLDEVRRIKDQNSIKENKVKLDLILPVNEASWVSRRIYDDIDKGLFSADFKIKPSKYSIEITIVISFLMGSVVSPFASKIAGRLADDLMDFLERKKKRAKRKINKPRRRS